MIVKYSYRLCALALGVLLTGPAAGADMAPKSPFLVKAPVAPGHQAVDWSGLYGGVHGGYTWTRARGTYDETGDLGGFDFGSDGFLAGGQIGYDWQSGRSVFGVVFDGTWTNISGSRVDGDGDTQRFDTDLLASARIRSGVTVDDKLLYSSIGVAYARNKFSVIEVGATSSESIGEWGLVTGLGVEWLFAANWSASAEYLHYRFDKRRNIPSLAADSDAPDFVRTNSVHAVRFQLNYRPGAAKVNAATEPAANFAGAYIGLHGGYGGMRSSGTYDDDSDFGGFVLDGKGFAGGGQIGYNWQRDAWVYGVEVDGTWSAFEASRVDNEGDRQKSEVTRLASARLRLGAVAGNKMFYLTGGAGYVRSTFNVVGDGPPATVKLSGVVPVVGSGVEWMFAPNWIARLEGLTYLTNKRAGLATMTVDSSDDDFVRQNTVYVVRGGVNYKY